MKRRRGQAMRQGGDTATTAEARSVEYLLDEYEHVAQAHFQTISSISAFFKHYLLIMAVPITLLGAAQTFVAAQPLLAPELAAAVLLVVAFAGLCVFAYIVNLRLDVMLYARTINAIRRYFMDRLEEDPLVGESVRVLPKNRRLPAYHEVRFFYPVALSFALIDGAYLALGMGLLYRSSMTDGLAEGLIAGVAFAVVHLLMYLAQAQHREGVYLSAKLIGVDLDGVVNLHRERFCEKLAELTGKVLKPDEIATIPVHADENTLVTREDEVTVFNSPDYWTTVDPMEGAAGVLGKLQTKLGYEIELFTNRDWPQTTGMNSVDRERIREEWKSVVAGGNTGLARLAPSIRADIDTLTRRWLKSNGMGQFPVTVEKRSRKTRFLPRRRDRFSEAKSGRFHIFIEDDPENATRLAQLCDLVLLIAHPYNSGCEMPRNVVRVSSWGEIWRIVCALPSSQ